jgi:hypothetical protein
MDHATQSWAFGDPTGWTIACFLFGLWSGVVGLGVYSISYRLLSMGSLDQEQKVSRRTSVVLGTLVALAIFSTLYFTSLSGFSQLDLRNGTLTFRYMLPERTMVLPFSEVMIVQEEPAFKGRWRLVLTTETNETYESALTSRTDVHRAGDFLRQQLAQPSSLRR